MSTPLELALAVFNGHQYATSKNREDEVKQGKNYYLASLYQANQIAGLSNVLNLFGNIIPNPSVRIPFRVFTQSLPFAGFAACPTFAAVKQGHYEGGKVLLTQKIPRFGNRLPEKLSPKTLKVFYFLSEHTGDITNAAMLVSVVALPFMGNIPLAGAMLIPVVYQAVDSRALVPRKVSLFMEKYMPTLSSLFLLVGGTAVSKAAGAAHLMSFSPQFNRFVHRNLDKWGHSYAHFKGATLAEIDAPLVQKKSLTYEEIIAILNAPSSHFEINPAHCSKWTKDPQTLEQDRHFDQFQILFDSLDWEKSYPILKSGFKDDERFLSFLQEKFPGKEKIKENFESLVEELALEGGVTKEQFLASQLKIQMASLIKILKGDQRVKGLQQDLDDSLPLCAQILFYLQKLDLTQRSQRSEFEDILKKLSIEGGDYCARGIKRASTEIINGILQQPQESPDDPLNDYELRLRQALEQSRSKILQATFTKFAEMMVTFFKEGPNGYVSMNQETVDETSLAFAQDVHNLDTYRKYLALGFYPFTQYERNDFGLMDLALWGSPVHGFAELRRRMYGLYKKSLHEAITELGETHFNDYIRGLIYTNSQLTEENREAITDLFISWNEGKWTGPQTMKRFHRLAFTMLGVLRYNHLLADWTEIEPSEDTLAQDPEFTEWERI